MARFGTLTTWGADAGEDPCAGVPSFDEIYFVQFDNVACWVRAMGGRDADRAALTREIFRIVRRTLPTFDGQNLATWLYGITKRTVSKYRRQAARARGGPATRTTASAVRKVAQRPEPPPMQRFLFDIIDNMTIAHRTAFVLFEIDGYTGREIAELEGVPRETVQRRLHQARKFFLTNLARARAQGSL